MIGEVWLVGFYSLFSFVEWREHNATIAFSFFFLSALSFLHNSFLFLLAKKIWLLLLILFNCCCCCWRVIVVYEWVRLMECEEWRDGDDSIVTRVWNSMPRFPFLESTSLKVLCFFFFFFFFFFEMICFVFVPITRVFVILFIADDQRWMIVVLILLSYFVALRSDFVILRSEIALFQFLLCFFFFFA